MGLLDSEAGKRRLLAVEIPILERYNKDRADDYKIANILADLEGSQFAGADANLGLL